MQANASRGRNRLSANPPCRWRELICPVFTGALVPCLFDDAVTAAIRKINLTATYGPKRPGLVICYAVVTHWRRGFEVRGLIYISVASANFETKTTPGFNELLVSFRFRNSPRARYRDRANFEIGTLARQLPSKGAAG